MNEYGGYIELDTYRLPMLHQGALALNCGRNCLAYLIETRHIKKILLPYFMCDSVFELCRKYNVEMRFYHVSHDFKPIDIVLDSNSWLYVMNYYGQLTRDYLDKLKKKYDRIIVDNAQAYYDMPIASTDTIYTCRKFFGVADGAFLYTDCLSDTEYPRDESFERMRFLLGRFERSASEFYSDNVVNNEYFDNEPIKQMSKLTNNLLHGIDYMFVSQRRTHNFIQYHDCLNDINELILRPVEGAFAYPFLVKNAAEIRKVLQHKNIYIPTLWPNVVNDMSENSLEYRFAKNILPLPCDQRYIESDIKYIIKEIIGCMKN